MSKDLDTQISNSSDEQELGSALHHVVSEGSDGEEDYEIPPAVTASTEQADASLLPVENKKGSEGEVEETTQMMEECLIAPHEATQEGALKDAFVHLGHEIKSAFQTTWHVIAPRIKADIEHLITGFLTALVSGQSVQDAAKSMANQALKDAGDLAITVEQLTSDQAKAAAIAKINADASIAQEIKLLLIAEIEKEDKKLDNFTEETVDNLVQHLTLSEHVMAANAQLVLETNAQSSVVIPTISSDADATLTDSALVTSSIIIGEGSSLQNDDE